MASAVRVRPMTGTEYDRWRAAEIAGYAAEMVGSGMLDPEAARRRAEEQHAEFLPQGRGTEGVHLLTVLDDRGRPAGSLWVGPHPRKAGAGFVYDVVVDEDRRGEGLGRAAMLAAEAIARDEGWSELGLNVFGPNERARRLYESLGYRVVTTAMAKPLP